MIKVTIISLFTTLIVSTKGIVYANEIEVDISQSIKSQRETLVSTQTTITSNQNPKAQVDIQTKREELLQNKEQRIQQVVEKNSFRSEEIKERIASRTAEVKSKLTDNFRARLTNTYRLVLNRYNVAILRLERILNRLEFNLKQLQLTDSPELENINTQIAEHKNNLNDLKEQFSSLENQIEIALSSEDPKTMFSTLRENIKINQQSLIQIHKDIQGLIPLIKQLHTNQEIQSPSEEVNL